VQNFGTEISWKAASLKTEKKVEENIRMHKGTVRILAAKKDEVTASWRITQ
jgi:hypothetical protein